MTAEQWESLDKTPGAILYTGEGRAGRLVSHIQYGATLDFTSGDASRVNRGYFPFAILFETDPMAARKATKAAEKAAKAAKPKKENTGTRKAVRCVETGVVYSSMTKAAEACGVNSRSFRYYVSTMGKAVKGRHFEIIE